MWSEIEWRRPWRTAAFPGVLSIKESIIKYVMEPNKAGGVIAHYRGVRYPSQGGHVPITGGQVPVIGRSCSAHCMGVCCIIGGPGTHHPVRHGAQQGEVGSLRTPRRPSPLLGMTDASACIGRHQAFALAPVQRPARKYTGTGPVNRHTFPLSASCS